MEKVSDCIFCKIAAGELGTELVLENDHVVAFHDLNPQAPVHLLIIPKQHIPSLAEVGESEQELLGSIQLVAQELAVKFKLNTGFRLVINCGPDGGQTVPHLHYHLLGGRELQWPPG